MTDGEDWSELTRKQRFGYWLVRKLSTVQAVVHHELIGELVWRTANGECIPLGKLTDKHLESCINRLIPEGDQNEMLLALVKERVRRGGSKREPFKCDTIDLSDG